MASSTSGNIFDITPYGYVPSLAACAIFLTLFGLSTIAHTLQALAKGAPRWMLVMSVGCLFEIAGWAGRLWSRSDLQGGGYILQQVTLVLGPTFYSAALYILLGSLIGLVAPEKSYLTAKTFKTVFIVADVVSIVLQGVGGGLAGSADHKQSQVDLGSKIMLSGIIVQLIVMIVYSAYALIWLFRARVAFSLAGRHFHLLSLGMVISSLAIIIRGVYRTIELSQGFHGALAADQATFLLDAIPSTIATFSLNVFHPRSIFSTRSTLDLSAQSPSSAVTLVDSEKAVAKAGSPWYARKPVPEMAV